MELEYETPRKRYLHACYMKPSGPGLLFAQISDYSFDFRACDGSVKIFYFFLVQFWKVVLL